jgi:hypothetical protein
LGFAIDDLEPVGTAAEIEAEKAMTTASVRDPINGDAVTFIGEDAEEIALAYLALAERHQLMIKEVYRMVRVALFGADAFDDDFDPLTEVEDLKREAAHDDALLAFPLPIEEALAIWERARDGLRWVAQHHPDLAKRATIERFLEQREAKMRSVMRRDYE